MAVVGHFSNVVRCLGRVPEIRRKAEIFCGLAGYRSLASFRRPQWFRGGRSDASKSG
jgi:hypothetical protein